MHNRKATLYHSAALFILILIAGLSVHIQRVNAQKVVSSPKPTASATPSPQVDTENAPGEADTSKETIEEIKRRIEKNSDLVKGVTDQKDALIGIIGEVTRITGESVTVRSQTATTIIALPETVIITSGKKNIKPEEIAVGNWVGIIGVRDDDAFTPRSISVSTQSLRPKEQEVSLGTISKINRASIEFAPRGTDSTKTLAIAKSTSFEDVDGNTIKVTDLDTDVAVLVVAQQIDENLTLATIRSLVPLED